MYKILVNTAFNSDSLDVTVVEFKWQLEADIAYERINSNKQTQEGFDAHGHRQWAVKLY